MNALMIVKDFVHRIRHSECCGSKIDLEGSTKEPQIAQV